MQGFFFQPVSVTSSFVDQHEHHGQATPIAKVDYCFRNFNKYVKFIHLLTLSFVTYDGSFISHSISVILK